jgi:putative ABC transport system permease protein
MLWLKNSKEGWSNGGPMSFDYGTKHVKTLRSAEMVSLVSQPNTINTYVGTQKVKLFYRYTDAEFWQINEFEFLEGKAYTHADIAGNNYGIVINDGTREKCFGKNATAVGRSLEIDNVTYKIIGVVRGCPITRLMAGSDVYLPYNTTKRDLRSTKMMGEYMACILAKSDADLPAIREEYASVVAKMPFDKSGEFDTFESRADTHMSFIAQAFRCDTESGFLLLLSCIALLFMALPALNLINISVSRMMERASEIGIRKAFGASKKTLLGQFVIENILLTVIGGALALLLSAGVIYAINHSGLIEYADLHINWMVAGFAIVISLVFGLMSGVYPAWRMSKMKIVDALKAG